MAHFYTASFFLHFAYVFLRSTGNDTVLANELCRIIVASFVLLVRNTSDQFTFSIIPNLKAFAMRSPRSCLNSKFRDYFSEYSEIYQNSVVFWVDINCISADMRSKYASLRSIVPSIPKLYGIVPTAREKVPIVDGVMLERVDRATMAVHHRF